ncbi:MAG TPA: hypothetical protein VFX16_28465 [Pseudonocardiaceae bacterium]|nr:hypothetical protein [Pseudonocardiaceae bacterium]
MAIAVLSVIAGAVLVIWVWLSVIRTVIIPHECSSRIARATVSVVIGTATPIARRLPPVAALWVLDMAAPLILLATVIYWLVALMVGFGLLVFGLGGKVEPVGFAIMWRGPTTVVMAVAAISVPLVLVAFTTHLVRLTEAYSRRERLVNSLAARASTPVDADQLLVDHLRGGSRDNLDLLFRSWLDWVADVHATHVGYPVLVYYRSARQLAWVEAAVIVMDAAALVTTLAPTWAPPHARVLLDGGSACIRDLTERAGIRLSAGTTTVSLQGREERTFGDTVLMALRAGLPQERNHSQAWNIFQAERTRYAPYAAQLCARLQYDRVMTARPRP